MCVDVCLFVGFWNHILLYYYVPFLCATPKPMNWAKQSKWSLVPLNTPWAGGSVWPFAAQHLSTTVSVSSLSFNLSLSHPGSTVQRLSLLHYTMHATFLWLFSHSHTALCKCKQTHADMCAMTRAQCTYIYTHYYRMTRLPAVTQCAELRGTAGFQLELMSSMSTRRREGKEKRRLDQFYSPFVIPTSSMDTQRAL